jgi:hypothetical protein
VAQSPGAYIKCEIATAKIVRTNMSANNKGTNEASEGSRLMGRQRWLTAGCSLGRHPRKNPMSKKAAEHHRKASMHSGEAAKHHDQAAKHHEAGQHEKAAHHAHTATGHECQSRMHADEAAKAHADEHGKKA